MRFTKTPQTEPIPGYRLLEPMGSGGFGEVWKCEAPGGLLKAIKFVYGNLHSLDGTRAPAEEELEAIQRVKAIRHPFLLSMERVECVGSELVIVMELADMNLHDRLRACLQAGLTGVARDELLAYLSEAAEALDLMNAQHNLQHLDIKPHNLFLVSNHVKVGDFGLVHNMSGRAVRPADALPPGAVTPLYASPETFLGNVSPHSDQYSLAIVYQELLTHTLPFTGKNARQLLMLHTTGKPNLGSLPESDRPAVAKALSKDPQARFPSCSHFVRALASGWIPHQLTFESVNEQGEREKRRELSARVATVGDTEATPVSDSWSNETLRVIASRTNLVRTTPGKRHAALHGYEPRQRLRSTPLSEVWRGLGPDGRPRLIVHVFGWMGRGKAALETTLARWQAARHSVLLEPTVLVAEPGRLVYVTAPVERTVRDWLRENQARGQPGIPRANLLPYFARVASVLDELFREHELSHLGLTPRQLLVENSRPRLAEFGLMPLFWLPGPAAVDCLNARYTAPELYQGRAGPACDQYSLAMMWCELLTGLLPRQTTRALGLLAESDRAAVLRALDPDPDKRWPSCEAFLHALGAKAPVRVRNVAVSGALGDQVSCLKTREGTTHEELPEVNGTFTANSPAQVTRQRLEGFRAQWHAEPVTADEDVFVYHVILLGELWQQCADERPGLEVEVRLQRAPATSGKPAEVGVRIRPIGCAAEQGVRLLRETGSLLFESLQAHLHAVPQRRTEERLPWLHTVQVRLAGADGELGEPIECQGKDISLNGIGFYAPCELPASQVHLVLPRTPQTPRVTTLATVVRVKRCGAGWFEVGAILLNPAPRPQPAEAPEEMGAAV